MRLTEIERDAIVGEAARHFGPKARVVLFGSRTDDNRRGGDVDLLVRGAWEREDAFHRKVRFLVAVKSRLGDQRIDVVVAAPEDRRPIVMEAMREGITL